MFLNWSMKLFWLFNEKENINYSIFFISNDILYIRNDFGIKINTDFNKFASFVLKFENQFRFLIKSFKIRIWIALSENLKQLTHQTLTYDFIYNGSNEQRN